MGRSSQKDIDVSQLISAQKEAAQLQYDATLKGIEEFQRQFDLNREDTRPWREAGREAIETIQAGIESGAFDAGAWEPPKWEDWEGSDEKWEEFGQDDFEQDPGYHFRMREGLKAINRQSGALGLAGSGATGKALQKYGQDLASQEFGAARARAMEDYKTRRGAAMEDYSVARGESLSEHQMAQQRLDRDYNRLAGLAGTGQQSVHHITDLGTQIAGQKSNLIQQGAAAQAAGVIGAAQAGVQGQIWNNQIRQQRFNNLMSGLKFGFNVGKEIF